MQGLYDGFEPNEVHVLERNGQRLWVEESGNPNGTPVIFLHGGPGSGCKPHHRRFFDPKRFRILLHDQRGCGRSKGDPPLAENNTQEILADLRYIQESLNISRWAVFGGSWGATLALLFAEEWPTAVIGMVLRGTFLARRQDLDWFVGAEGVRRIYPEAWESLFHLSLYRGYDSLVDSLYQGIRSKDIETRWKIAAAWERWGAVVTLGDAMRELPNREDAKSEAVLAQAEIELHFAHNHYFLGENQVLENIARISDIPTVIIHGRRDLVCPCDAAILLHRALPKSRLCILEGSAHVPSDDAMIAELVQAAQEMAHVAD